MSYLYAEYEQPATLAHAIEQLREAGATRLEAYLPYPVPEIERALAARPSGLSVAVLAAGLGGAAGAYGLQWLLDAYLYPLDAGGRPPHFPLSFVPITFEMGVLLAGFTAVISVFVGGGLLRLWHRASDVEGFESATNGRFWLEVNMRGAARDDIDRIMRLLANSGALIVREVPA